jgi:hypothetical protein
MHLGIYTLSGVRAWMAASADAAFIPRGGIARTVFSFARSFITMGNDGTLFKRFLSKDPYNPVSIPELLRLSLWKLAFFYLMIAALAISLTRSKQGRRALGLLIVASLPVMVLALLLEGGAVDRYMPIFPFFFLALGIALSGEKRKILNVVMIAFFVAAAITNLTVLSVWTLRKQQEASAARIRDLQPQLKPQSLLLTANLRDELVNFNRSFPLHPVNLDREHPLRVGSVIAPGAENVSHWQRDFSAGVLKAWEKGGDVWISRRVLSPQPHGDWGWVESDDPRVSWKDVYSFFSQLEIAQSAGGEDGFVLIAPTPGNTQLFRDWSTKATA